MEGHGEDDALAGGKARQKLRNAARPRRRKRPSSFAVSHGDYDVPSLAPADNLAPYLESAQEAEEARPSVPTFQRHQTGIRTGPSAASAERKRRERAKKGEGDNTSLTAATEGSAGSTASKQPRPVSSRVETLLEEWRARATTGGYDSDKGGANRRTVAHLINAKTEAAGSSEGDEGGDGGDRETDATDSMVVLEPKGTGGKRGKKERAANGKEQRPWWWWCCSCAS